MSTDTPSAWAHDKLSTARTRNLGPVGVALHRMAPQVMPRVPIGAWLGFIANSSGPSEDTAESASPAPFHELGYFGTPAGPISGPAPNPNPAAPDNAWGHLANSDLVKQLLGGHGATMEAGAWRRQSGGRVSDDAINEQVAVGLADLKQNYASMRALLPANLQPDGVSVPVDVYGTALMFGAWSAGASRMASHVRKYAAAVGAQRGKARWGALLQAAINDPANHGSSHTDPAYSLLRSWQKLQVGQELATELHEDPGWYSTGLSPESAAQAALVARVTGSSPGGGFTFTAPSAGSVLLLLTVVGVVGLVGGVLLGAFDGETPESA